MMHRKRHLNVVTGGIEPESDGRSVAGPSRPSPFLTRLVLLGVSAFGLLVAGAQPPHAGAESDQAEGQELGLRIHGLPVIGHPGRPPEANRPAGGGDRELLDPVSGMPPEAAPYTDPDAPFDPFAEQAPRMDLVTWNPAWISERLAEPALRAQWPGLRGIDEVSRAAEIRASSLNASEKVWLRHWYEPTHLNIDLNADGRLTDADNDGRPDAASNPEPSAIDEWFPAIMTELSYMLLQNDPLPQAAPPPSQLQSSAPRPTCGLPGATAMVFPVGTEASATDPNGPQRGRGLTSLDADFDGRLDMLRVADEASLPSLLDGLRLDFDGDGTLDRLNPDGLPLSCDEMVVLHTETLSIPAGGKAQLLDHFVSLEGTSASGATLKVWYHGDLLPRPIQTRSIGIGSALLAGDTGPLLAVERGPGNLGVLPPGAWFVYLADADPDTGGATVILGRALGAPCSALQSAPGRAMLAPGKPWFLKRFYVDGHAYDLVALGTCPSGGLQYLSLRSPIPKVDVRLEQHSVRLQGYAIPEDGSLPWLPLPPPFNHEHTRLEDVGAFEGFADLDPAPAADIARPSLRYMGGPFGPVPPLLEGPEALPYTGRIGTTATRYADARASRWTYVSETVDPDASGQIRELPVGNVPRELLSESPPRPGIRLDKTVYRGHDEGLGCPGAERVVIPSGARISYCFRVVNTGRTWLDQIRIQDPSLGVDESAMQLLRGQLPLRPGASAIWYFEAHASVSLINRAEASGRPVTPAGEAIPQLDRIGHEDEAEVEILVSSIEISKTVYAGHDGGAGCPGGERSLVPPGTQITYCFAIRNTGASWLTDIRVEDPALGIDRSNMPLLNGSTTLAPGAAATWYFQTRADIKLFNLARTSGTPADENGRPYPDADPPEDEDEAEVDILVPSLRLNKTVYSGHDRGAGCPGAPRVEMAPGAHLSFCFEITNTGQTWLSQLRIEDPTLGIDTDDLVRLSGSLPLAPGSSATWYYETRALSDMLNTATATGLPSDPSGRPYPGAEPPRDEDTAEVDVSSPGIRLSKTVYLGHDAGAGCPGSERVDAAPGARLSYCFAVSNTGETWLDQIRISDPQLGIDEGGMGFLSGSFPLAPGATATWFYEARAAGSLVNIATTSGSPSNPDGSLIPGAERPSDDDAAEVAVALPGIRLAKTVYAGHNGGRSCPGAERVVASPDSGITYCFAVTNSGQTWLDDVRIEDLTLGIEQEDLVANGGTFPLARGASAYYYYQTTMPGDLINIARVTARPTDERGSPIPGANRPSAEDQAEVDAYGRDYGDAPSSRGYPSLRAQRGASHVLLPGGPVLGLCADDEPDGQPDPDALGDDRNGSCDDEDGLVLLSTIYPRLSSVLRVSSAGGNATGMLSAWIDFNQDGDWNDAGEKIISDQLILAGRDANPFIYFEAPENTPTGVTFLRLRISSQAGLGPEGPAPDGEVEDYKVEVLPLACPAPPIDGFRGAGDARLSEGILLEPAAPGPVIIEDRPAAPSRIFGDLRKVEFGPFSGGNEGPPVNVVYMRIYNGRLDFFANPDSRAPLKLDYDRGGAGLNIDLSTMDRLRIYYLFDDAGSSDAIPLEVELDDGVVKARSTRMVPRSIFPFFVDFPLASFAASPPLNRSRIQAIRLRFDTSFAQDFILDEIVPCPPGSPLAAQGLRPDGAADGAAIAVAAADAPLAPSALDLMDPPAMAFYNEQILALPRHYTEFLMPDLSEFAALEPDRYHVKSALKAPAARWRRWEMPDAALPARIPPAPADLIEDHSGPPGRSRSAAFWFDPDVEGPGPVDALWIDAAGAKLYGGQAAAPEQIGCELARRSREAGDDEVLGDPLDPLRVVESLPYTDPWSPFNPRHPHAPRGDSITVNPAYMDAFRHHGEPLAELYGKISINDRPARQKVYHRLWYEPEHLAAVRQSGDCARDLVFPALMQEYSFIFLDSSDRPSATQAGTGRLAFPMAARAEDLPLPGRDGRLPAGGEAGRGIGSFDADFDGRPDALTVHSELTLANALDAAWQSVRPSLTGPPPVGPGPVLDFNGDGYVDVINPDTYPQTGDELIVLAAEDLVLDLDPGPAHSSAAMLLDHMVTVEGVTRGERARLQLWFTGERRPAPLGGPLTLEIGQALVVDRFQDRVTRVAPGQQNPGLDGAWFVYLTDVSRVEDQVTLIVGRALGATHSAMGDGAGGHDLLPGDPWYLKRFYVEGQAYDLVALMSWQDEEEDRFSFLTLRTALPLGDSEVVDAQNTLRLSSYLPESGPVPMLPPFDRDHTIAVDIEHQAAEDFGHTRRYDDCVGPLAPFGPLEERIVDSGTESRYSVALHEIRSQRSSQAGGATWQLDQARTSPDAYLKLRMVEGQTYLYTSTWRSPAERLHGYGCRVDPSGTRPWMVTLSQAALASQIIAWGLPTDILPTPNEWNPPQPRGPVLDGGPPIYAPWYDARLGRHDPRVQRFFDPAHPPLDLYVNRVAAVGIPPRPEPSPTTIPPLPPTATPRPTAPPIEFRLQAMLAPDASQQVELGWAVPPDGSPVELAVSIDGSAFESLNPGGAALPGASAGAEALTSLPAEGAARQAGPPEHPATTPLQAARPYGPQGPGRYLSPAAAARPATGPRPPARCACPAAPTRPPAACRAG